MTVDNVDDAKEFNFTKVSYADTSIAIMAEWGGGGGGKRLSI